MVNNSICLRRTVSSMSFVRICVVTMTILRLFLCMCARARYRERMRRRQVSSREETDEEKACGSLINSENRKSPVVPLQHKLMLGPFLAIKKQILFALTVSRAISMKKLGPTVRNLSPHQALVDPQTRQVWQDKRFHQLLRSWFRRIWRKSRFCQQDEENFHRLQTVARHQVLNKQMILERKEFLETAEKETSFLTTTWAESSESNDLGAARGSCRQVQESLKGSQGFQELEENLKSLLDHCLAQDEARAFNYKECLACIGDTCPCLILLPNQLVGLDLGYRPMSNCPLSFTSGPVCEEVDHRERTNTVNGCEDQESVASLFVMQ